MAGVRLTRAPPRRRRRRAAADMTLPPSIGVPSIADSCYSCFDYTNGLADLVVGYMGAPFTSGSEMTTAPLMVTVRNGRGRQMLERAVAAGRVEVLQRGGKGGAGLLSEGDRAKITLSTFERDSLVQTLTNPDYVAGDRGAPPLIAGLLARVISQALPKGMEFARYSIDYHYLRNLLFVEARMGATQASRHVPRRAVLARARKRNPEGPRTRAMRHRTLRRVATCRRYAQAIMARYMDDVQAVRDGRAGQAQDKGPQGPSAEDLQRATAAFRLWLTQFVQGVRSSMSQ